MKIGGFNKLSLSDYPGYRAAVVFTQGCNWRCPYCFQKTLVVPSRFQPTIPEKEVLAYLEENRPGLDALVVSGGEPTIHGNLASFLQSVQDLGLKIKLETNGSRPAVLADLFHQKLLDFVAMDLKGPLHRYSEFTGIEVDPGIIELSLDLIAHSEVPYEIRMTLVGGLHTERDFSLMAPMLSGIKRFAVQAYRLPPNQRHPLYHEPSRELFHAAGEAFREEVEEFVVR